jgi:hypothetical protein
MMQTWDLVMVFMLFYTAFYTTYQVSFPEEVTTAGLAMDTIVLIAFTLDIVIKFNLAFTCASTNRLVTNHVAIAKHYLRKSFVLDFVSTFPWDLIGTGSGSSPRLIRLLRLMKLLRLLRTSRVATAIMKGSGLRMSTFVFIKMLLIACAIIHWCACMWMLVGSADEENGWKSSYYIPGDEDEEADAVSNLTAIARRALKSGKAISSQNTDGGGLVSGLQV